MLNAIVHGDHAFREMTIVQRIPYWFPSLILVVDHFMIDFILEQNYFHQQKHGTLKNII